MNLHDMQKNHYFFQSIIDIIWGNCIASPELFWLVGLFALYIYNSYNSKIPEFF